MVMIGRKGKIYLEIIHNLDLDGLADDGSVVVSGCVWMWNAIIKYRFK